MKNKTKKILSILVLSLVSILIISGCSAGQNYLSKESVDMVERGGEYDVPMNITPQINDGMGSKTPSFNYPYDSIRPEEQQSVISPPGDIERKFIQNGVLEMRSKDVLKTADSMSNRAAELGGRISSSRMTKVGDSPRITMTVVVPFGRLEEFMTFEFAEVSEVITQDTSSEEVTEYYYELETRISTQEGLLTQYRELLKKAETIEEILIVQSKVDTTLAELEVLKGKKKVIEARTSESTINITVYEEKDTIVTKPDIKWETLKWSDIGYIISSGAKKIGMALVLFFQYLLIVLVFITPPGILILITVFVIKRTRKKKRAKREKQQTAKQTE